MSKANWNRRLNIVFTSILSLILIFGAGTWVGYSFTGTTNTFAPGSLETATLNVTGDWYRGTTNLTDRLLGIWGALSSTTLDTGQGAYELYGMDQDMLTSSSPTFDDLSSASLDTGHGANELYDMDQNVLTTSSPTFDALTAATLDTGQGANELYDMDQNVLSTSSPTFDDLTVDGLNASWIDLGGDNRTTWPSLVSGSSGYGAWTYLIVKNGSFWLALDECMTVDYNSSSATTTIQNAVDAITTGLIFIKDPGSTIILTSDIVVNGKRITFSSDWATIQSASGEYAFNFSNSHGFSHGNPYGGLQQLYITGNSRSGNGLLIDDVQGGLFRDLIFSGCNIGIKLTLTSDFTEGNSIQHVSILSPNYGIIFEGTAVGTGSFMDTSIRDIRINLDITGSTGMFFDAANGNVKPHNSRFENIHMWLKADYICGMNFSDNGVTVQLWDTGFLDLVFELYTTGTENCTGIYVGNDVNVDKYPYWLPMPRFINTDGADWTHVSNVRIDNSNNICLGTGTEKYGQVNWSPDGTKIYRFYANDSGAWGSFDLSGSYD